MIENQRKNWETFDDEKVTGTNNQHQEDNDEDYNAELPTPRELFTEGQINHNVTYSFENVDHSLGARANSDELTNIFLPVSKGGVSHAYLYSLSFYNNCLLQVSITAGTFVFFTLFPSYLYYSVSFLHTQSISHIVSIIFMASLVEACFIGCWKFSKNNRKFPIALLLWLSAIGNFCKLHVFFERAMQLIHYTLHFSDFGLEKGNANRNRRDINHNIHVCVAIPHQVSCN